jgi:anti-sigma regulatory factor (Ser/Thr protein kinase)
MAAMATGASDAVTDLALMAGAAVLGSLTIPGRPEHVREARAYVAKILGDQHAAAVDVAVLLASEIVTNAVTHTNSCHAGGTVRLVLIDIGGGVRVEVTDDGTDLRSPVVKGPEAQSTPFAADGHGLFLVQSLAQQWGYVRDELSTTVWFWLNPAACS